MDKEALIEILKRALRHGRDDAIEELAEFLLKKSEPKEKKPK